MGKKRREAGKRERKRVGERRGWEEREREREEKC